jgi:hypothetical protein
MKRSRRTGPDPLAGLGDDVPEGRAEAREEAEAEEEQGEEVDRLAPSGRSPCGVEQR